MALIPKASNIVTKGINEAYGILATGFTKPSQKGSNTSALGAMYDKFKSDLAKGKENVGGFYDNNIKVQNASASEGDNSYDNRNASTDEETQQLQKNGPASLYAKAKNGGSGSSSNDSRIIGSIGKGWDEAGGVIGDTKKSLNSSQNYINNLGKVRDQYLTSIDNYKKNTDSAIAGNKTLIEQNQKKDLDSLAKDTRKSMDNTNVMLGVKGASGGSASRMAARAISESAGRERASRLTERGDQMSSQNQAAQNALDDYNTKRGQAYEWEKTAREQAMEEYTAQKKALDRLNNKKSGWKEADIAALSDKNLNSFMGSINAIQQQAKAFRDNLSAKMSEYGGLADALDTAAVGVDAPAELDTPQFDETIDITDPNNAEDWYNPDKSGKITKKFKGYDAMGNPIYEDEAPAETVVTA
ncbi:MAG: hypothetical protein WC823_00235 [Parcubacteria group bacterium]|jgi:hypothetical protein